MDEYEIGNKKIELDTSKTYLDFYWENGQGQIVQVKLDGLLGAIQSGEIPVDDDLKKHMQYLRRWETDAPRKRVLRDARRQGMNIMPSDALFEQDGGEEIIDNLENTGVFAAYFLREVYEEE